MTNPSSTLIAARLSWSMFRMADTLSTLISARLSFSFYCRSTSSISRKKVHLPSLADLANWEINSHGFISWHFFVRWLTDPHISQLTGASQSIMFV
jgi:hypothetical protein